MGAWQICGWLALVSWVALAASPARGSAAQPAVVAFEFPAGSSSATLPMRIASGQIIVRLFVAGRGADVILDSGSADNIIDPTTLDVDVADARLGHATIHGLGFVRTPFFRRIDQGSAAVGILGYGFLRHVVVKIDYQQQTVALIDPQRFQAPDGELFEIPVDLSTKVPFVQATLGSALGDHFVIDTGATADVVFGQFARAHASEFSVATQLRDSEATRYIRHYYPLCGSVEHQPYAVASLAIGGASVRDWVVWVPDEKSCFQSAWDGLIGYDFLRVFTVYLDYERSRVLLVPNELYPSANAARTP